MKRFTKNTQQKMSMHHHKGVPTNINKKFHSRRVDAAFISSITAKKLKHLNLGIIAKKEVLSVIVISSDKTKKDSESATSNVLAKILNINGEVLIGDKALKYVLGGGEYVDLAYEWRKKYNLPFVFALLCYHKDKNFYEKVEKNFLKQKNKIPQYLLEKASQKTKIDKKDILNYLSFISYKLDKKAKKGLKLFYRKTK